MDNNTNIDNIFGELDQLAATNHERRNALISKVMEAVDKTDFDPSGMRASELESRLGMVSTIDSLMKSQESVQVNKLKLNLQKKSDEEEADHSAQVIELLQRISPTSMPRPSAGDDSYDPDEADDQIAARIKDESIVITEGEKEKVSTV